MKTRKATCHRTGAVTYWSVYKQAWQYEALYIPDRELAAMGTEERSRVIAHYSKFPDLTKGVVDLAAFAEARSGSAIDAY